MDAAGGGVRRILAGGGGDDKCAAKAWLIIFLIFIYLNLVTKFEQFETYGTFLESYFYKWEIISTHS